MGKDTTTGHWEIAGLVSQRAMPTYPHGFPEEIIREYERLTGRKVLCNRPYSGTDVIRDLSLIHISLRGQLPHLGTPFGRQTVAPKSIIAWLKSPGRSSG